ncbi:MAG TPA: bifunctional oligoribonuclease/PAP phosphatase NrnA [Edaphocola sp.]|nr:bifunctional oligoribonuclease/PAP phosphatase NrnA [Edaphocola sp.]
MLNNEQIFEALKTPKKIFITCHQKPDADAIGSTLGLYHYLKLGGHQATIVVPNEIPDFLHWMPELDKIINFESEPKESALILDECDLIFCLDFNHLNRVKGLEKPLRAATQNKILIDHHLEPELDVFFAGVSNPDKSSTCEMVYDFIVDAGDQELINNDIATCLYTGTLTDTGSFRFPGTTASTHRMVAFFKDKGLEHAIIHERIYDCWSENRMRFIGHALEKKMEILENGKLGIIAFSEQELDSFNIQTGDTEGLVNLPLSIEQVKVSVLLTQKNGSIKLSFRSKGQIDVSSFCRKYFNGGGHFNAAGGHSQETFEKTLNKVKTTIKEIL